MRKAARSAGAKVMEVAEAVILGGWTRRAGVAASLEVEDGEAAPPVAGGGNLGRRSAEPRRLLFFPPPPLMLALALTLAVERMLFESADSG